jgi:hypothetical protein
MKVSAPWPISGDERRDLQGQEIFDPKSRGTDFQVDSVGPSTTSHCIPKTRMAITKSGLVFFFQTMVSLPVLPLLILSSIVENQSGRGDKSKCEHANVDRMAGNVARSTEVSAPFFHLSTYGITYASSSI